MFHYREYLGYPLYSSLSIPMLPSCLHVTFHAFDILKSLLNGTHRVVDNVNRIYHHKDAYIQYPLLVNTHLMTDLWKLPNDICVGDFPLRARARVSFEHVTYEPKACSVM